MQRGRKLEAVGALALVAGVVAMVAGSYWGTIPVIVGFVIFLIGRFL